MSPVTHLLEAEEIEIPVIEIVPGWDAMSLTTIEECEDAHIKIGAIIAEIEYQIDMFEALKESERDYAWLARAKRALRYKKIAAQCVNNCRSRLGKTEKEWRARVEDRLAALERAE